MFLQLLIKNTTPFALFDVWLCIAKNFYMCVVGVFTAYLYFCFLIVLYVLVCEILSRTYAFFFFLIYDENSFYYFSFLMYEYVKFRYE